MATKTNTVVNGRKYYRMTKTIGHELKDGKKVAIKKQFYGASKGDAQRKYEEWLVGNSKLKEQVITSNRPLGQLIEHWKDNIFCESSRFASTTKTRYCQAFNQFKKSDKTKLLQMPAQDVGAAELQNAYKAFDTSMSTLEALNKFFRAFVAWAVTRKYCTNFMDGVEMPKKKKKTLKKGVETWDKESLDKLDAVLEGHRFRIFYALAVYAGLRPGEILGLDYSDIYDNVIHVRKQWTDENEFSEPKWKSSRNIPVIDVLQKELIKHEEWHKKESHKVKNDLLFTTTVGTPYNHKSFRNQFEKLCEKNGIEYKSPHSLRATYCTRLYHAGVSVETASELMGHKSIETTMRHYIDIGMKDKRDAQHKLEEWLKSC